MKKFLAIILMMIFLTGCELPGSGSGQVGNPTSTGEEMATRVAQMLTSMPTVTLDQSLVASKTPENTATSLPTHTPTIPTNTPTLTLVPSETMAVDLETPTSTSEVWTTPTVYLTETPTMTAAPTYTAVASPTANLNDPRLKLGTASWNDMLNDASNFYIDEDEFSAARVENGTLVITGKQRLNAWRLALTDPSTNIYIEALMTNDKCAANDSYGIIFRVPSASEANRGYLFGITCTGNYYVKMWDGYEKPNGELTTLIYNTPSDVIIQGSSQYNRVGVMAIGDHYYFYVNGVLLDDVVDDNYLNGYFGLFVKPSSTIPFSTRIEEVAYWLNPLSP